MKLDGRFVSIGTDCGMKPCKCDTLVLNISSTMNSKFRSVAMLPGTATGHNGCWVGTKGGRIDRRFSTWYTPVQSFSNGNI